MINDAMLAKTLETLLSHADFRMGDNDYNKQVWSYDTGETNEQRDRMVIEALREHLKGSYPVLCRKMSQGWF